MTIFNPFMILFSSPIPFLAHLSRRLTGVLIGYPWIFTFSNVFSSETTWPIKAKFYVEPPWEGGKKVYINGPGHITKMAAMPIYGKYDPGLILTYFTARSNWVICTFEWGKLLQSHIMEEILQQRTILTK